MIQVQDEVVGDGLMDKVKRRWRYGESERGRKVRTLAVGAGEEEVSDCLRLEIVAGLVADAGRTCQ